MWRCRSPAQREYVGQVAEALKARGVRCFYDADEQVRLWGTYLAEELPRIYARESAAVVVFISADYVGRDWTRLERRAAFSRAVAEAGVYVLPARFDDSELPGLLPDMVTVDLRRYTPEQFADLVVAKLTGLGISPPSPSGGSGGRSPWEVRTGAADPRRLGVHVAINAPGESDEIPSEYVPPDADAAESGVRAPMAVKIGLWGHRRAERRPTWPRCRSPSVMATPGTVRGSFIRMATKPHRTSWRGLKRC